jgi:hypothetical protein
VEGRVEFFLAHALFLREATEERGLILETRKK